MKRTLRLRREQLGELTAAELVEVVGGTTPFVTNGHNCFGTSLCFGLSAPVLCTVLSLDC